MSIIKAYIWDLDGTLLDSYGSIVSSLVDVSRECGVQDSREEIMKAVKQGTVTGYLRNLSERTGKDNDFLYQRYRETSHERLNEIGLVPGAVETLEALRSAGARHFVYTHRGRSTGQLLDRLGLTRFFEEIVTFEYGYQPKPSGDGVNYLVEKYGLDRNETAYVGDRSLDVACAVDAGVIAVLYLPEGACVQPTGEEDMVIQTLEELTEEMSAPEIRMLEKLAARAHEALETIRYDGWLLRFAEGYTGRSNSVGILLPSRTDLNEKVDYCEKCYRERNLPCMFKLTDADAALGVLLKSRGYQESKPTDVMTAALHGTAFPDIPVVFSEKPSEEWLRSWFAFEGMKDESGLEIFRRILEKAGARACYAAVMPDGKIAACAASAAEKGYALIQYVVVDPEYRRRGLGRAVCQALMAEAEQNGVKTAYLQVMQNNPAAISLYSSLGFRKAYTYRYFVKQT